MKNANLDRLRPTQMTHGAREVAMKVESYRELSEHELIMAIAEKPVPFVTGPKDDLYLVDHHHVVAALHQLGIRAVPVVLLKDLSTHGLSDFWLTMEDQSWTHPFDANGQRQPYIEMPVMRGNWQMMSTAASRPPYATEVASKHRRPHLQNSDGRRFSAVCCHRGTRRVSSSIS